MFMLMLIDFKNLGQVKNGSNSSVALDAITLLAVIYTRNTPKDLRCNQEFMSRRRSMQHHNPNYVMHFKK